MRIKEQETRLTLLEHDDDDDDDDDDKDYNMYRGWTQTDYQNKHYNINQKWLQHVQRMDTNGLPKQALQYKPKVATTCTEDGHKQTTKTSTTI